MTNGWTKSREHAEVAAVYREYAAICRSHQLPDLSEHCDQLAEWCRDLMAAEQYEELINKAKVRDIKWTGWGT